MNKAKLNYFVDLLLAISFLLVAVTGILKFPGWFKLNLPWKLVNNIHDWSGLIMAFLVLIHLFLHWKWIVGMTKSLFKGKKK